MTAPNTELLASGPDAFADAKAALTRLRDGGRTAKGTFAPGNMGALKTGEHSDRLMDEPALAAFHRARVAALIEDLGGPGALTTTSEQLVSELARVQLFTEALGENVMQRGALTGKGKTRAAVGVYLTLLERQVRLAQLLGLDRRAKDVTPSTPSAWLESQAQPQSQETR